MFRASPQSRTVTFSWRPVNKLLQNGIITDYTITCTPSIAINIPVNTNMDLFSISHQRLTPATQYSCNIVAITVVGSGPSATLVFTTMDDGKVNFLYPKKNFYHCNVVQCYTLAYFNIVENYCSLFFLLSSLPAPQYHCCIWY